MNAVELAIEATDGDARTGVATTATGRTFRTPCFIPVATQGSVKTLDSVDLARLGVDMVLANTYHLALKPGADVVETLGGLHRFMAWDGPMLTDSGGFQVFSLGKPHMNKVRLDDDGVTFQSTYDGSSHRFTPEIAVAVQRRLGADIQMVLDVCPPLPSPPDALRRAVELTGAWAARARAAHGETDTAMSGQAQFGIVQGGTDVALRRESAARTVEIGFDGYAIGGLSVGESRDEMTPALTVTTTMLPSDRIRYLMGVGDPARLADAVAAGVDMFDCVLPTRHGRHGTILTDGGKRNLRNARFATDDGPLDPGCDCPACARWSRGYLRHLLSVDEPTGRRLVTMHNVAWTLRFVDGMRAAIRSGRFEAFHRATLEVWGGEGNDARRDG